MESKNIVEWKKRSRELVAGLELCVVVAAVLAAALDEAEEEVAAEDGEQEHDEWREHDDHDPAGAQLPFGLRRGRRDGPRGAARRLRRLRRSAARLRLRGLWGARRIGSVSGLDGSDYCCVQHVHCAGNVQYAVRRLVWHDRRRARPGGLTRRSSILL